MPTELRLNLIADAWIPVRLRDGSRKAVAPWQVTDPEVLRPDWPRTDLNVACYEFLIGLVFMALPPADSDAWDDPPDADTLRQALLPFAPAFELLGEGPVFLQEPGLDGPEKSVEILFIDSAGGSTATKNGDLLVHRARYDHLDLPFAAMALYTLQAFAPSGGAGNRTSMRGGGPMVTLVDPGRGLWSVIWANVPCGTPAALTDLPWMQAPRSSKAKGSEFFPEHGHPSEAFFGMPRKLRLVADQAGVCGVVQVPWGTNYTGWRHPTSPYYRQKEGSELLPVHPKAGAFGYHNWLGIVVRQADPKRLRQLADMVEVWDNERGRGQPRASLVVAGWAMSNATPLTFVQSVQPLVAPGKHRVVELMIEAADTVGRRLRGALGVVLADGSVRENVREAFFAQTQGAFESAVAALSDDVVPDTFASEWITQLRHVALGHFDAYAIPALEQADAAKKAAIVKARNGVLSISVKGFEDFNDAVRVRREESVDG